MWNVWRTVLEENEKLARARLAAVESLDHLQVVQKELQTTVQDVDRHKKLYFDEEFSAHDVRDKAKDIEEKRFCEMFQSLDHLQVVQKELQTTVQDVDRHKKLYFDEEFSAHDVRDKAKDIEEKLKKKKGSFFTSITSLQKNSAKFSAKREICDSRSTGARNDYLLSLSAANAHQTRYFVVDLQTTMMNMESQVFEHVQEYLTLIGRTELLTCSATQTSFTRIRDQAKKLTREYNLQCCYLFFPVLKQHIQYDFEACCDDPVDKITVPDPPNGPAAMATSKMKTEARIECLKNGGVNVEEFMQEVESLSTLELPRSSSALSVRTDASGEQQASSDSFYDDSDYGDEAAVQAERDAAQQQHEERELQDAAEVEAMMEAERAKIEQMTAAWDDPTHVDWGTEDDDVTSAAVAPSSAGGDEASYKCVALYNYT
ncbi:hypothetical protein B566_EDAN018136, partial [Ephemera danica]